jgi:hypothetical protein
MWRSFATACISTHDSIASARTPIPVARSAGTRRRSTNTHSCESYQPPSSLRISPRPVSTVRLSSNEASVACATLPSGSTIPQFTASTVAAST